MISAGESHPIYIWQLQADNDNNNIPIIVHLMQKPTSSYSDVIEKSLANTTATLSQVVSTGKYCMLLLLNSTVNTVKTVETKTLFSVATTVIKYM